MTNLEMRDTLQNVLHVWTQG